VDPARALCEELSARLGGAHEEPPGGLLGVEQEFTVGDDGGGPVDFRALVPMLDIDGVRLDPADPNARRLRSGLVVTVDGPEAEMATPPVAVQPGFTRDVAAWARAARTELAALIPEPYTLSGYSTHLSVAVDDAYSTRVGALYARTFAAGLMLLVDRVTSPGLIVRPRPRRTELCGEFVDGPWLRAASVFAAGSVLACRDALVGARPFASLPPQLQVLVRPASARAGWYVDRRAFGPDLLTHGRVARLRRCDGRRISAQDHLEAAWASARAALGARASSDDLAVVDALVDGTRRLPGEVSGVTVDAGEPGPLPAASPLGSVGERRVRPGFTVDAFAATWKLTVFRVESRARARAAYVSVPRAHHARFFTQLETGALDDVLGTYLALEPADRVLVMTGTEPSIGDVAPSGAAVTDRELDRQLAATVVASSARADKYGGVGDVPRLAEIPGPTEGPLRVTERRGCLPGTKWILIGGVVVALVIGGIVLALTGGGADEKQSSTPVASTCGADATGSVIRWDVILKPCDTTGPYEYDPKPFQTATINVSTPSSSTQLFFGKPCAIHDATTEELNTAKDGTFVGLSLIGVPIAGLPPGALVEVVLLAPDGTTQRTGHGVADKDGYAEVHVPINVPQTHKIVSARYFPGGSATGPSVAIAPTSISATGEIAAALPGNRCDRAATLALLPKSGGNTDAAKQAHDTIVDKASVYPLVSGLKHPAADLTLTGPWTVDQDGEYFAVRGDGYTFDALRVGNAGGDTKGDPPVGIYYHGGAVVFPTSVGTAKAWAIAYPCGPGQLALTVCPKNQSAINEGGDRAYAAIAAVFDHPVPAAPNRDVKYTFTVGGNAIAVAYHSGKWSLAGSDEARFLIRNNVVLLLVPAETVGAGGYRISTSAGGKSDTQPPSSSAAAPLKTTIAADGLRGAETAQQFVTSLAAALTNGDAAFLRARLHPVVVERYGSAGCDAYAAGQHTPTNMVAQEVHAPDVFAWQSDGLSRDVPDTNTVVTVQGGQTSTIHIALVDGLWRWFADCGAPLPNAR
jgi:hypothetical protein